VPNGAQRSDGVVRTQRDRAHLSLSAARLVWFASRKPTLLTVISQALAI
jgi:hypothetical protein